MSVICNVDSPSSVELSSGGYVYMFTSQNIAANDIHELGLLLTTLLHMEGYCGLLL